MQIEDIK